ISTTSTSSVFIDSLPMGIPDEEQFTCPHAAQQLLQTARLPRRRGTRQDKAHAPSCLEAKTMSLSRPAPSVSLALTLLFLVVLVRGPAAPPADEAKEIARLIQKLGSDDSDEWRAAEAKLKEIGAAALAALRKAEKDDDPDIRLRATLLVKAIEKATATIP